MKLIIVRLGVVIVRDLHAGEVVGDLLAAGDAGDLYVIAVNERDVVRLFQKVWAR